MHSPSHAATALWNVAMLVCEQFTYVSWPMLGILRKSTYKACQSVKLCGRMKVGGAPRWRVPSTEGFPPAVPTPIVASPPTNVVALACWSSRLLPSRLRRCFLFRPCPRSQRLSNASISPCGFLCVLQAFYSTPLLRLRALPMFLPTVLTSSSAFGGHLHCKVAGRQD